MPINLSPEERTRRLRELYAGGGVERAKKVAEAAQEQRIRNKVMSGLPPVCTIATKPLVSLSSIEPFARDPPLSLAIGREETLVPNVLATKDGQNDEHQYGLPATPTLEVSDTEGGSSSSTSTFVVPSEDMEPYELGKNPVPDDELAFLLASLQMRDDDGLDDTPVGEDDSSPFEIFDELHDLSPQELLAALDELDTDDGMILSLLDEMLAAQDAQDPMMFVSECTPCGTVKRIWDH